MPTRRTGKAKGERPSAPTASDEGLVHVYDDTEPALASFALPLVDGWFVEGDVAIIDGQLAITRLTIRPGSSGAGWRTQPPLPSQGLTTKELRSVKTPQILNRVYREVWTQPGLSARWEEYLGEAVPAWRHQAEKRAVAALEEVGPFRRPGGRRKHPEDHYERIARLYLDLQQAGFNRGILNEIADREGVNRNTARDWVSGATKRGLLSPGGRGVAGRTPGPNLANYKPPTSKRPKRQTKRS